MMKEEFEKISGVQVTPEEYEIINTVYTWHPTIENCGGKEMIAELYNLGGMRLIKDMLPTAKKIKGLDLDIINVRSLLHNLESKRNAICKGLDEEEE